MNDTYGTAADVDSGYAWLRLLAAALIGTIGNVGMWSVVVVLPALQADFGVDRGAADLHQSAVAGLITEEISVILLAGKPPFFACSLISSSSPAL